MYKLKDQQQPPQDPHNFKQDLPKNIQNSIQQTQKQSELKQNEILGPNFSRS